MARILIQNGRVWNGEEFLHADVLTDGETVVKVEDGIKDLAAFVYNAAGKIVSAGFVDTHVHLRGISSDVFGIQPEAACFPFGVTAAADASGVQGSRALMDSFMLKSVTFAEGAIRANRFDVQKTEANLRLFGERAVGIKVYFDTTITDVRDITPLREICTFAHAHGLRVMVHCAHSPVKMADILRTLGAGDILTHAFHGQENNAAEEILPPCARRRRAA
ncbi:MAG: hypothetical protein IJW29_05360 [Clostridia bacterium]|nr:hypothetical protein [Clostridia bacterium]